MYNKPINQFFILLLECDYCVSSCIFLDLLHQVDVTYHHFNSLHTKPKQHGKAARRVRAFNNSVRKTSARLKAIKLPIKQPNPAKSVRSVNFAPHSVKSSLTQSAYKPKKNTPFVSTSSLKYVATGCMWKQSFNKPCPFSLARCRYCDFRQLPF